MLRLLRPGQARSRPPWRCAGRPLLRHQKDPQGQQAEAGFVTGFCTPPRHTAAVNATCRRAEREGRGEGSSQVKAAMPSPTTKIPSCAPARPRRLPGSSPAAEAASRASADLQAAGAGRLIASRPRPGAPRCTSASHRFRGGREGGKLNNESKHLYLYRVSRSGEPETDNNTTRIAAYMSK